MKPIDKVLQGLWEQSLLAETGDEDREVIKGLCEEYLIAYEHTIVTQKLKVGDIVSLDLGGPGVSPLEVKEIGYNRIRLCYLSTGKEILLTRQTLKELGGPDVCPKL